LNVKDVDMDRVALATSPAPQATTLYSPTGENNGKCDGVYRD
jgi:hypothetical protein